MGYQIYPQVSSGGGSSASTAFFTVANTNRYWANVDLASGVYNFAGTVSHANCEVALLNASDTVLTTITVSGITPVVVTITETCKKLRFIARPYRTSNDFTPMGSIQIGVTLVGALNNTTGFTGTIAEYTTTQPISINGTAYVLVVGGGGGSNSNTAGYNTTGGASGCLVEKYATNWSGLYTVTIGNGGGASTTGGTTTLTNTGGTIMSAGGGQGATNAGNQDRNYFSTPANSGGDHAGFSAGGAGSNQGNAGYQPYVYPYPAKYQWAKQFTVQGGVGGGGGIDLSTGYGNGANGGGGYSGNSNARGNGNGGGGSANSSGSAGAVWVVTGLQEII
jgi:hypothetical protein